MEKIEKARMQQKHDVATNWNNIEEFVPKPGEIIVYDKDENVSKQSIKIGDGETPIGELSFITGEIYTSKKEPKNAGEGAVWITLDDNIPAEIPENGEVSSVNSNWNVNIEGQLGYIKNRPLWHKQAQVSIPWNESYDSIQIKGKEAYYVSNLSLRLNEIADFSIYITTGKIPYGNISVPDLPSYDAISYPYYILSFSYNPNEENWKYIDFFYSNKAFVYNNSSESIIRNGETYRRRISFGSTNWSTAEKIESELLFKPGLSDSLESYIRFYSSHDIIDENYITILNAYYFSSIDCGEQWAFGEYITNQDDLKNILVAENVGKKVVYFVNGAVYGYASNSYFLISVINNGEIQEYFLGFICGKTTNEELPAGIYYFANSIDNSSNYICRMDIAYSTIKINEIYQKVFKDVDASNIYILDEIAIANAVNNPIALQSELMRFRAGDIILLPSALLEMMGD